MSVRDQSLELKIAELRKVRDGYWSQLEAARSEAAELEQLRDGMIGIVDAVIALLAEYGHPPGASFGVSSIEYAHERIAKALREALNKPRAEHAKTLAVLRELVEAWRGMSSSTEHIEALRRAELRLKEAGS